MYAVIETGGKQHRVQVGDVVKVEKIAGDPGASVVFDRVLLVTDAEDRMKLGTPTLDGVHVKGTVLEQGRHAKIHTYTYKRRQNSNRRRQGHRQAFTAVKIDAIEG